MQKSLKTLEVILFQSRSQSPDSHVLTAYQAQNDSKNKVKRERSNDHPRPRKAALPKVNSTQLELDGDGGNFRETPALSVGPLAKERDCY